MLKSMEIKNILDETLYDPVVKSGNTYYAMYDAVMALEKVLTKALDNAMPSTWYNNVVINKLSIKHGVYVSMTAMSSDEGNQFCWQWMGTEIVNGSGKELYPYYYEAEYKLHVRNFDKSVLQAHNPVEQLFTAAVNNTVTQFNNANHILCCTIDPYRYY